MSTKLNINMQEKTVEVEGSEDFVKYIYESIHEKLFEGNELPQKNKKDGKRTKEKSPKEEKSKPAKKTGRKSKTFKIVNDLNFTPLKDKSLKDFYSSRKVGNNNFDRNVVFVYYLEKILRTEEISMDHIYSCYKHMGVKVPGNLYQSIVDTKNKKGFIDYEEIENIYITVMGENHVEIEMDNGLDGNE